MERAGLLVQEQLVEFTRQEAERAAEGRRADRDISEGGDERRAPNDAHNENALRSDPSFGGTQLFPAGQTAFYSGQPTDTPTPPASPPSGALSPPNIEIADAGAPDATARMPVSAAGATVPAHAMDVGNQGDQGDSSGMQDFESEGEDPWEEEILTGSYARMLAAGEAKRNLLARLIAASPSWSPSAKRLRQEQHVPHDGSGGGDEGVGTSGARDTGLNTIALYSPAPKDRAHNPPQPPETWPTGEAQRADEMLAEATHAAAESMDSIEPSNASRPSKIINGSGQATRYDYKDGYKIVAGEKISLTDREKAEGLCLLAILNHGEPSEHAAPRGTAREQTYDTRGPNTETSEERMLDAERCETADIESEGEELEREAWKAYAELEEEARAEEAADREVCSTLKKATLEEQPMLVSPPCSPPETDDSINRDMPRGLSMAGELANAADEILDRVSPPTLPQDPPAESAERDSSTGSLINSDTSDYEEVVC